MISIRFQINVGHLSDIKWFVPEALYQCREVVIERYGWDDERCLAAARVVPGCRSGSMVRGHGEMDSTENPQYL